MDKAFNWEEHWKEWRNAKAENEHDLFFQVGRTIQKKPIEKEVFDLITADIISRLGLNSNDILVELCCGNGLCTYELKDSAKQIIAVDFAPHLIEAAQRLKSAPNITYTLGSVFDFLDNFKNEWKVVPTKFLMNNALAYFTPPELEKILKSIVQITGGKFIFLLRDVPNEFTKWNFYNTEERKQKYYDLVAQGDTTNDGLGRWWSPAEIMDICDRLHLGCVINNQRPPISDYRMDIIISH